MSNNASSKYVADLLAVNVVLSSLGRNIEKGGEAIRKAAE